MYRDDLPAGDVAAASTRASVITQRFGGVRYALSRPGPQYDFRLGWPWQARQNLPDGGESDPDD